MTTCDGHTHRWRVRPNGCGTEHVPCRMTVGLRAFTDRSGVTRHYCSTAGHEYQAMRRYGVADPPEPEWAPEGADPITAAKGYHEWQAR